MLELKNVSFEVTEENNRKEIIRDVSAVIDDSKFIVITGPNGGGKSTLAKLIAGIEKPTSGKIFFDGTDITDLDIAKRARLGISFRISAARPLQGNSGAGSAAYGGGQKNRHIRCLRISLRGRTVRQ